MSTRPNFGLVSGTLFGLPAVVLKQNSFAPENLVSARDARQAWSVTRKVMEMKPLVDQYENFSRS